VKVIIRGMWTGEGTGQQLHWSNIDNSLPHDPEI